MVRPPDGKHKNTGSGRTSLAFVLSALISLNCTVSRLPALAAGDAAGDTALAAKAMSLQTRIFGKAPANQQLVDRITALETYLMGKPQTGELEPRLTHLQEMLDGKPRPPAPAEAEVAPVNDHLFDVNKPIEPAMPTAAAPSSPASVNRASSADENPDDVPASEAKQSFVQSVKKLEERVFGQATAGENAATSLEHLETFALGKAQGGTMAQRLARLEAILNGTAPAAAEPSGGSGNGAQAEEKANSRPVSPQLTTANADAANAAAAATAASPVSPTASGRRLRGHVDSLASTYALAGITLKSNTLPSLVDVRPSSRAYKAGLADNDKVLHAELGVDTLSLAVERQGHKFMMEIPLTDRATASNLRSDDSRLASGTAATAAGKTDSPLLIKGTVAEQWKILKKYSIGILLDVSGSMHGRPPEIGISKLAWCQQEINSLATEAEQLGNGSFDFGLFTNRYAVTPNCNAAQVQEMLANLPPGGGTNIAAPLQAEIDTRSSKPANKPFLIVVITDGVPGEGEALDDLLVGVAKQARSAADIKIIFLQVGPGPGQMLADYLDTQLINEGAPYDIVSSVEWTDLARIGLRSGLIAALQKPADKGGPVDPAKYMAYQSVRQQLNNARQHTNFNNFPGLYGGMSGVRGMNMRKYGMSGFNAPGFGMPELNQQTYKQLGPNLPGVIRNY